MHDPNNTITEQTTLAELREQRLLLEVIALRVYPSSMLSRRHPAREPSPEC